MYIDTHIGVYIYIYTHIFAYGVWEETPGGKSHHQSKGIENLKKSHRLLIAFAFKSEIAARL